ncbi:MAG TPA: hypothetical protein VFJ50_00395 [Gemmatimonadales bacterium]|nr:hypothetical protein [Gemmatimonadales bacterium]
MADDRLLKRVCEISYVDGHKIAVQWFNAERDTDDRVLAERQAAACGFVYWVGGMIGRDEHQAKLGERLAACAGDRYARGIIEQLGGYRVDVPPISDRFDPVYRKRMYRIGVPVEDPTLVFVTHQGFGFRLIKARDHYLPTSPFALLASLDRLWADDPARRAFLPALCEVAARIMQQRDAGFTQTLRGYDTTPICDEVLAAASK